MPFTTGSQPQIFLAQDRKPLSFYSKQMAYSPKMDLVGVGLNAMDTLIPLPAFPAPGSKTEYTTATVLPAGKLRAPS